MRLTETLPLILRSHLHVRVNDERSAENQKFDFCTLTPFSGRNFIIMVSASTSPGEIVGTAMM
jgi:hypothetical protein